MIPIDAVQCADMLSDKLNINIGDLVDLFAEIPTLDVVPREEVDRLRHMLDSYAIQYGTVKDQHAVIDRIKAETAREIFEEIENIAYTHFDVRGDEESLEILIDEFAELKKKYMEGLTDGKTTDR